jgi:hypothetical protein
MMLYLKILCAGFLLVATAPAFASREVIPYENVIEREYNRMRGGAAPYNSIQAIISQNLRGKSIEQKNQIIADLRALKQAIHAAWSQAEHDGKRIWQWGYIWKDNNAAIQSLAEHEDDVTLRLQALAWESQSDFIKLLWISSKYIGIAITGIATLYLTQGYLSQEYYQEHGSHGIAEMLLAPAHGGIDALATGTHYTVRGIKYGSAYLAAAAQYAESFFEKNPTPSAQ